MSKRTSPCNLVRERISNDPIGNTQIWPANFTPWDPENESVAKEWFEQPQNANFMPWATAIADKPDHWTTLVQCLLSTLKMEQPTFSATFQKECTTYWGHLRRKKQAKKADLEKLGPKIAQALLKKSTIAWKEEATTWMQQACVTFAPRAVSLWKKVERRKEKELEKKRKVPVGEGEGEGEGDAMSDIERGITSVALGTPPVTPKVTISPRRRKEKASAISEPTQTRGHVVGPPSKRQRRSRPEDDQQNDEAPLHHPPWHSSRHLIHRTIVVILETSIAEKEAAPSYTMVGIAAIVEEGAYGQEHEDIRCEHLSYEKFRTILQSVHRAYDPGRMRLTCQLLAGTGQPSRMELDDDEDSFKQAMGILSWQGSAGDFFMTISGPRDGMEETEDAASGSG
jgi:hypothetical protein